MCLITHFSAFESCLTGSKYLSSKNICLCCDRHPVRHVKFSKIPRKGFMHVGEYPRDTFKFYS